MWPADGVLVVVVVGNVESRNPLTESDAFMTGGPDPVRGRPPLQLGVRRLRPDGQRAPAES